MEDYDNKAYCSSKKSRASKSVLGIDNFGLAVACYSANVFINERKEGIGKQSNYKY